MRQYRRNPKAERLAESRKLGFAAYRVRDEAERLAIPPPPPDLPPGSEWMHWPMSGIGWAADVRLLIPADRGRSRPRSDQFTLEIDGEVIAQRMGLTAIMRHLQAEVIVKQATRAQRRASDLAQWHDA
jgi:hypothetical protein